MIEIHYDFFELSNTTSIELEQLLFEVSINPESHNVFVDEDWNLILTFNYPDHSDDYRISSEDWRPRFHM